jgi:hypothetical protein
MGTVDFEGILTKKHHYWRNLVILLAVVSVISVVWYVQDNWVTKGTPNPVESGMVTTTIMTQGYEEMCSEFPETKGELSCINVVRIGVENTGDDVNRIEKSGSEYLLYFGSQIIIIDAKTGELV